jgi:phosphosulfolactate phosphohydrolase-like enzyme
LGQGTAVTLLASGTSGREALEDTGCAGAIAEQLRDLAPSDEATQRAIGIWREYSTAARVIAAAPHAASLRATGHEADLAVAALVDSHPLVAAASGSVIRA